MEDSFFSASPHSEDSVFKWERVPHLQKRLRSRNKEVSVTLGPGLDSKHKNEDAQLLGNLVPGFLCTFLFSEGMRLTYMLHMFTYRTDTYKHKIKYFPNKLTKIK